MSKGFTYLVANDSAAPPPHRAIPKVKLKPIVRKPGSKCARKWTQRRVRWNLRQLKNAAVMKAIQENETFLDSAATSNFNNNESNLELTGPSCKQVAVADGHVLEATHMARLPMTEPIQDRSATQLIQDRSATQLTQAYQNIFNRWKATNVIAPKRHILDNEAPEDLKNAIRGNGCWVELTPADIHRRNAAERAIQTLKGHFISVLAGVADNFPISEWDQLLPQTVLTLNLL
eukprot:CCRYP_016350-RA/>CCRYP_016350-RA protein AED:0.44 eAED:0.42 QI:0/-1/0/1/-1/1/1/0/231